MKGSYSLPLLLALLPLGPLHAGQGFVSVRDGQFSLDGETFRFTGANNYYLVYKPESMAEDVFASAKAMGLQVIRTWGFLDGKSHDGVVLQPELGKFNEEGFRQLDRVVEQAARHGLKLVITLVNRWDDFGGMKWYVEQTGGCGVDEFYTRQSIKDAYKSYVAHVVNRVNTRTGVAYKDDPAIFAWQLANEPRCPSDPSGDTLVEWAREMSAFIKSLDANHLVSVGDEGLYRRAGDRDWTRSGKEGVDWLRLLALPDIDYGTVHLYPDHWDKSPDWGAEWIREHLHDARKLGKPVVIEEFGLKDKGRRDGVYEAWLAAAEEEGAGGTMVWLLTGKQEDGTPYPDYDGFDVKFPGPTAGVMARHARRMSGEKDTGFLSTKGRLIVDAAGKPFRIAGVSWFGFETDTMVPHGLWQRSLREMAAQIRSLGFNTVRIPFSQEMLRPEAQTKSIDFTRNPDLKGRTPLECLDEVIAACGAAGLRVVLDCHSAKAGGYREQDLWYWPKDEVWTEKRWIDDWVMLAKRYAGDPTVIGADLFNEPKRTATWGAGHPATDWNKAAERCGKAIHAVNPDWLIIVQGVAQHGGEATWWGGNLAGVETHPVVLARPGKLVYSPHDYPAGVYRQAWFEAPDYPDNLPAVWDRFWGFIPQKLDVPILLGEFGGKLETESDRAWLRALMAYLRERDLGWIWWSWNPNSADTGGILQDDWVTVDRTKMDLLPSAPLRPLLTE
jgi:mannan endo-1,4-beta-mannosidase